MWRWMHKGGEASERARRTVTNYRYANGAKREDEREEGRMRISRGKSAHPRRTTHCEEINLNGLTLYAISAWGAGAARRGAAGGTREPA